MENNTAKHFVLQLGSLVSLYLSIAFLLVLLFGVINLIYPDAAEGYWAIDNASSSVRLGIAMVIVFFPTYLILTRLVNQNRRIASDHTYLGLTKWLIYLSLLIGGITLLVDLVVVIMAFLEGEITSRFILKAGAVLFIVGAAFYYYLLDAKGYWLKEEKKSIIFGGIMSFIILSSVIGGFVMIEAPSEVREARLDAAQIDDLRNIQYQIEGFYNLNDTLPESLQDLENETLPEAPEDRVAYSYELTERGFKLCATFTTVSTPEEFMNSYLDPTALIKNRENWTHPAGRHCFARVVGNVQIEPKVELNLKP